MQLKFAVKLKYPILNFEPLNMKRGGRSFCSGNSIVLKAGGSTITLGHLFTVAVCLYADSVDSEVVITSSFERF